MVGAAIRLRLLEAAPYECGPFRIKGQGINRLEPAERNFFAPNIDPFPGRCRWQQIFPLASEPATAPSEIALNWENYPGLFLVLGSGTVVWQAFVPLVAGAALDLGLGLSRLIEA